MISVHKQKGKHWRKSHFHYRRH